MTGGKRKVRCIPDDPGIPILVISVLFSFEERTFCPPSSAHSMQCHNGIGSDRGICGLISDYFSPDEPEPNRISDSNSTRMRSFQRNETEDVLFQGQVFMARFIDAR